MYQMVRTFNSVGQGAFYTEEFYNQTKDSYFTMVYDCGSYESQALIESEIKHSELKKDIDLLCISHFHADHINGLEYLLKNYNIKKILLPFLHEEERIEVFLENIANNASTFITEFSLNPKQTISKYSQNNNIKIISIEINTDIEKNNDPTHIEELGDTISSGQQIKIDNNSNWIYVPFNFSFKSRSRLLKTALSDAGIDISKFTTEYASHKDKIIEIYRLLKGDPNTNSLVIYSGPIDRCSFHTISLKPSCHIHNYTRECGCIYMGDYNAKGTTKWNEFDNAFKQYFDYISIIQIPHHGSRHNYNPKLNFKSNLFSIMSAGIHNKYRHPHGSTLKQIILNDGIPIIVTENPHSKFIQKINFIR